MPRIATDKLLPGMVLSADVKDLSGRMLLKSGTAIEGRHLKVLRTWGVLAVEIAGEGGDESQQDEVSLRQLPASLQADIEAEAGRRFAGVDASHPVMQALLELVKAQMVREHVRQGAEG